VLLGFCRRSRSAVFAFPVSFLQHVFGCVSPVSSELAMQYHTHSSELHVHLCRREPQHQEQEA